MAGPLAAGAIHSPRGCEMKKGVPMGACTHGACGRRATPIVSTSTCGTRSGNRTKRPSGPAQPARRGVLCAEVLMWTGLPRGPKDGGTDASASPQNDKIERWCRGTQIRGPGKSAVRRADDIRPYNSPAAWFGAPSRRAPRRHDPTTMRRAADSRPCPRVILSAAKDPFPPSFRETSGDGEYGCFAFGSE